MRDESELSELIRSAAGGDRAAFEALVGLRRERVFRTAYQITGNREDALDVAQGVFLRLWSVLRRFDLERRFDTWLYRITVNAAIDVLRQNAPQGVLQPLPDDPSDLGGSGGRAAESRLELAELQRAFLRLAARLAPKQRAIFVMREIEGLGTPEIARALGVTESTVRNHLLQARRVLRAGIESDYPELVPRRGRPSGGAGDTR